MLPAPPMSTPWFFLSYARFDEPHDLAVESFYNELVRQVRLKSGRGLSQEDAGFLDRGMTNGTDWESLLADKLGSCRVLVCLYSPSYFSSKFCGKEFTIFRSRLDRMERGPGVAHTPFIKSVLWGIPRGFPDSPTVPQALKAIQYDKRCLEEWRTVGGLYDLKREAHDKYLSYISRLATEICEVAESPVLPPPLTEPLNFKRVRSAFHRAPAPPRGLLAKAESWHEIGLSWSSEGDEKDGFRIERRPADGGDFSEAGEAGENARAFRDELLAPSTGYVYRVCAINGGWESPYSESAQTVTHPPPAPPAEPPSLSAKAVSQSQVSLTWRGGADLAEEVEIERCVGPGRGGFRPLDRARASRSSYEDIDLTPGTTYRYRARFRNVSGTSADSDVAEATTLGTRQTPDPPAAPDGLKAAAAGPTRVGLAWTDKTGGQAGIKVERKPGRGGPDFEEVGWAEPGAAFFGDAGLTPWTTYIYRVRAYDGLSDSAYSNEVIVVTPPTNWVLQTFVRGFAPEYLDSSRRGASRLPHPSYARIVVSMLLAFTAVGVPYWATRPVVANRAFSDTFTRKAAAGPDADDWENSSKWDFPSKRWGLLPSEEPDTWLVVSGTTPGFMTDKLFVDFEADFTVNLDEGQAAGWVLRAQRNFFGGDYSGYYFTLSKPAKAGDPFILKTTLRRGWRGDTALEEKKINIAGYGRTGDNIWVQVRALGGRFDYAFRLQNSDPNDPRDVALSACYSVAVEDGTLPRGFVGLFAPGDRDKISVDYFKALPITPETKTRGFLCLDDGAGQPAPEPHQ